MRRKKRKRKQRERRKEGEKKRGRVGREGGRKGEARKLRAPLKSYLGLGEQRNLDTVCWFFSVITADLYFKLGTSILFPLSGISKICFQENFKTSPKFKSPSVRS